jgi:predicted phosphodiesterase
MSKILIISDTHGNHALLKSVLKKNMDCEYLIHLGDEPDDLDRHSKFTAGMSIFSVYGLYHNGWTPDNSCVRFTIAEVDFVISHSVDGLVRSSQPCIYCYGHTHHRTVEKKGDDIYINPGHLKKEQDRGESAGYMVMHISDGKKSLFCFDYQHNLLQKIVL